MRNWTATQGRERRTSMGTTSATRFTGEGDHRWVKLVGDSAGWVAIMPGGSKELTASSEAEAIAETEALIASGEIDAQIDAFLQEARS